MRNWMKKIQSENLPKNKAELNTMLIETIYVGRPNRLEVSKLLIEKGADVNAFGNGNTPLILAATSGMKKGDIELAKLLIKNGANVNLPSEDGVTALMMAAEKGDTEFVTLLLENSADVNARDENGKSVLKYALHADEEVPPELLELLKAKGAKE